MVNRKIEREILRRVGTVLSPCLVVFLFGGNPRIKTPLNRRETRRTGAAAHQLGFRQFQSNKYLDIATYIQQREQEKLLSLPLFSVS